MQIAITNPFVGVYVPSSGGNIVNVNATSLGNIVSQIIPYVFGAAAILLLIYLVLGGLRLMISRGDPKGIEGAKAKITNALLGFVIVILAVILVKLIGLILGISVFANIFT